MRTPWGLAREFTTNAVQTAQRELSERFAVFRGAVQEKTGFLFGQVAAPSAAEAQKTKKSEKAPDDPSLHFHSQQVKWVPKILEKGSQKAFRTGLECVELFAKDSTVQRPVIQTLPLLIKYACRETEKGAFGYPERWLNVVKLVTRLKENARGNRVLIDLLNSQMENMNRTLRGLENKESVLSHLYDNDDGLIGPLLEKGHFSKEPKKRKSLKGVGAQSAVFTDDGPGARAA